MPNAVTGTPRALLRHLGFDRAMGHGLEYEHAFGATHLGWIGRAARPPAVD